MSLWDSVKQTAQKAGNVAMIGATRTKLRTEILLVDRDIKGRQQCFGVTLYDHVEPLAKKPEFYSSDDRLTNTLRAPLLVAQREIAALQLRMRGLREDAAQAEVKRAGAFPNKAVTWGESMVNAGKSAKLAGNETKIKTEMAVVETQIKGHKQQFGVDLYAILVKLEDEQEWLPTDRQIRSIYDQARQDVEKLKLKRKEKEQELIDLGGSAVPESNYSSPSPVSSSTPAASAPAATTASMYPDPTTATQPPTNNDMFSFPPPTDASNKGVPPPAVASETPIVYATPAPAASTNGGSTNGMFGYPSSSTTTPAAASLNNTQSTTTTSNGNHHNATGIFAYPGAPPTATTNTNAPHATPVSTSDNSNNDLNGIFGYPGAPTSSTSTTTNGSTNNMNGSAPNGTVPNVFAAPPPASSSDPFADLLS